MTHVTDADANHDAHAHAHTLVVCHFCRWTYTLTPTDHPPRVSALFDAHLARHVAEMLTPVIPAPSASPVPPDTVNP